MNMICEFKNCTTPFKEIANGGCFAFPSGPQGLYLKTKEEICDDEGNYINAVHLSDGAFFACGDNTPVIAYPMAKVVA